MRNSSKVFLWKRNRAFCERLPSERRLVISTLLCSLSRNWYCSRVCQTGTAKAKALCRRWSTESVSDTGEKHCVLPTHRNTRREMARGLDEKERKWQSTTGITLRFLLHCVVRRCSFRRASCPRLVGENIEEVPFLSLFLFFLFSSRPSFFLRSSPLRGSLPCAGCSFRMAKTTQLWDTRGESREPTTTSNNSFCGLRCWLRLLLARWL